MITAVVFAAYSNTLSNGFVYDDNSQILRNAWITSFKHIGAAFTTHSFGFLEDSRQAFSYRPMVYVVYMLEYALFGLKPMGWHLVNIILHAINSSLVFLVASALLNGEKDEEAGLPARAANLPALAAGILFAVHPVNSEVAAWAGCIPELSYTLLSLAAFYIHARSRDWARGGFPLFFSSSLLPALLFFLALLFKETAVFLPVLIFIYDSLAEKGKKAGSAGRLKEYLPFAAFLGAYIFLRLSALGVIGAREALNPYLGKSALAINSLVLLSEYLGALVLPVNDSPFQVFKPVLSIYDARVIASIAALTVISASIIVLRKKTGNIHCIAFTAIILPLLPTLYSPVISRFPFADRYLYFPTAGLSLLAALILKKVLNYGAAKDRAFLTWTSISALAVLIVLFGLWAAKRNTVWKDDYTLWSASLEGSPENYFALYNIGIAHLRKNLVDDGIGKLEESLAVNKRREHPDQVMLAVTHKTLAMAYAQKGLVDRAILENREYLGFAPESFLGRYNLAALYQRKGLLDEAVEAYRAALRYARKPDEKRDAFNNLGNCYAGQGRWEEAFTNFESALREVPGDPLVMRNLEITRRLSGRM